MLGLWAGVEPWGVLEVGQGLQGGVVHQRVLLLLRQQGAAHQAVDVPLGVRDGAVADRLQQEGLQVPHGLVAALRLCVCLQQQKES